MKWTIITIFSILALPAIIAYLFCLILVNLLAIPANAFLALVTGETILDAYIAMNESLFGLERK